MTSRKSLVFFSNDNISDNSIIHRSKEPPTATIKPKKSMKLKILEGLIWTAIGSVIVSATIFGFGFGGVVAAIGIAGVVGAVAGGAGVGMLGFGAKEGLVSAWQARKESRVVERISTKQKREPEIGLTSTAKAVTALACAQGNDPLQIAALASPVTNVIVHAEKISDKPAPAFANVTESASVHVAKRKTIN